MSFFDLGSYAPPTIGPSSRLKIPFGCIMEFGVPITPMTSYWSSIDAISVWISTVTVFSCCSVMVICGV